MQKDKWEIEYTKRKDLPSSRTDKPSRALLDFLSDFQIPDGSVLDIGSGFGRNSIHLAKLGRRVVGIEISEHAIREAKKRVAEENLAGLIEFHNLSAGEPKWPFPYNEFVLALDMMVLHVLDIKERENYSGELNRVLKPGGYFTFYTIAADSPAAQDLFEKHPGPEPNSYIVPQSGMIEKGFTEKELKNLFEPLKLEKLDRKTESTPAFGDVYERVYYSGIMKKV